MSRYPRIVASFVDTPTADTSASKNDTPLSLAPCSTNNIRKKLETALEELSRPFKPHHLAETVQQLLQQRKYRLHQHREWRAFNGLTGSWIECQFTSVTKHVRKAIRERADAALQKMTRLEHTIADSAQDLTDKSELLELIRCHQSELHSRAEGLSQGSREIQRALATTAPDLTPPSQDAFASSGQGCYQISEREREWQRLRDDDAAKKHQLAFVTGKIPQLPSTAAASEDTGYHAEGNGNDANPATMIRHALCRALYRGRSEHALVVQLFGEQVEAVRRKILGIGGGYVVSVTPHPRCTLAHARVVLLDLTDVSHRTATKAVRRILELQNDALIMALSGRDQTPLHLGVHTKLLYADAEDVVSMISHDALLPAALGHCGSAELPTAADVRATLLRQLLQRWMKCERVVPPHQNERGDDITEDDITDAPAAEQRTVGLSSIAKALSRTPRLQSFFPSQREISCELERLGFTVVNHSNTLKVRLWQRPSP